MSTQSENHFILKNDENFLKEFLSDFYQKVTTHTNNIDDFENFENIIINNWINNIQEIQDVSLKKNHRINGESPTK